MKILITGDFCPVNRASGKLAHQIIDKEVLSLIENSDLTITNLECPLTVHEKAINKTGPALKSNPENIKILKDAGFNMVTLANNHIMDYGEDGMIDTLEILSENKIDYVGAGKHTNPIGVSYCNNQEFIIAIINICENEWSTKSFGNHRAYGLDPVDNFALIQEAKAKADKVVVIHHGGHEMYEYPSPRIKKLFRFFVDAGADTVINHHTHCTSGYEIYKNAPIFYSLGNFIFDDLIQKKSIWNEGMVVVLELNKGQEGIKFELHPYHQFGENPQLETFKGKERDEFMRKLKVKSKLIEDDEKLKEKFSAYCTQKQKMYNSYLEPQKNRYLLALRNRGLFPSLWSKRKRLFLQNLIRCESHRDVVTKILKNENSDT